MLYVEYVLYNNLLSEADSIEIIATFVGQNSICKTQMCLIYLTVVSECVVCICQWEQSPIMTAEIE